MQIPWKRAAVAVLVLVVLAFLFFIRRKKERFESSGKCTADQDEIDGACYERCREGFSANGTNCYEKCKPEEKSEGPTCISPDGTSRTMSSYARSPVSNVQAQVQVQTQVAIECDEGYDSFSEYCIEKCKDGFTKTGFMCLGNCPSNTKTLGIMCADDNKSTLRESYFPNSKFPKNKDTSNVTPCPDGYNINGAMCIENCPSEHVLKGSFCVEKCKPDETDLDTMCLKGQALRKKRISVPRVSSVPTKNKTQ